MPNIKGISINSKGDVSITGIANLDLTRDVLITKTENINTGLVNKTKTQYNVYTHCYEDLTKINTKRTAVMVCQKGYIPRKNWWVKVVEDVIKSDRGIK